MSLQLAGALARDLTAPVACVRILRRRRPDAVLGAGGYVGGPMVLAAGVLRIPAALLEADAELGLANRLAAPFVKRVFCAFPLEGMEGPKYRVVGRPIPARSRAPDAAEARASFGLPAQRSGRARLRGQSGGKGLERRGARGLRGKRPGDPPSRRRARLPRARAPPASRRLPAARLHRRVRRRAGRRRPRRRARRRLRLGGGRCGQARPARPVPACDRRPPGEERRLLCGTRRCGRRSRSRARPRAAGRGAPREPRPSCLQCGRRCLPWRSPMPPTSSPRS